MSYEITEVLELSGRRAGFYAIRHSDDHLTTLDHFINEHVDRYTSEIRDIIQQLAHMGDNAGIRKRYFRDKRGGYCELFDRAGTGLRLQGYRMESVILIIGGGITGSRRRKPSKTGTLSEMSVSGIIRGLTERIRTGDIYFSADGLKLLGNLRFISDERQ